MNTIQQHVLSLVRRPEPVSVDNTNNVFMIHNQNVPNYTKYNLKNDKNNKKIIIRGSTNEGRSGIKNRDKNKKINLVSFTSSSDGVGVGQIMVNGAEPTFTEAGWSSTKGVKNNNCYSYAMNNFSTNRPYKAVPGDRSGFNHNLTYDRCPELVQRLLADNPDMIYKEVPNNTCAPNFSKIMMFVGSREGNFGDFHFYKHHNDIEYLVKKGDTIDSVAKFLQVDRQKVIDAVKLTSNTNKNIAKSSYTTNSLSPGQKLFFKNFRTRDNKSAWSHKLGWATGAILNDSCGKLITDPRNSCRKFSTIDYTKYCGTFCIRNGIAKSS